MEYIAIAVAAFFIAILIGITGVKAQTEKQKGVSPEITLTEAKNVKRADIQQRLQKLADSKPPAVNKTGAMCYSTAAPPQKVQYICPKCGEKTLYTLAKENEEGSDWRLNNFIEYELDFCRREAKAIKGISLSLDESQFCKKCTPDLKSPKLAVVVNYEGEKKPHRVEGITRSDLQLIAEFLSGSDVHTDEYDCETPLKKHVKRLSELLGVDIKLEKSTEEKTE